MSRPDPKPATLALADLLGYKLAHSEHQRAAAELQAAEAGALLARQQLAHTAAQLEQARVVIANAYELTDGDSFDRNTGQINRAPVSPIEPKADKPKAAADQGDDKHKKGAKPNGAKETSPNVP